ncbi:MAG: helix-turn-helix transcriptional regulator [Clostridia bacterium]|nr:helix-turn-helix transcriptional regulator [Clostridia bacterium]
MKLHLGETIRQLRLRDGRTQEDLADALGITCQAVSRWEKGGAYPDLESIPAIANFFGISIDELFGYENEREKKIDALTERIYEMNRQNNGRDVCMDECIRLAREGVAEFPGNEKLMLCLASMLFNAGYVRYGEYHYIDEDGYNVYDTKRHKTYAEWAEAIKLYEKLLTTLSEGKMRQTAVRELVQLYLNTGEKEKSFAIVDTVPSVNDCREILRLNTCDGKDRAQMQGQVLLNMANVFSETIIGGVIVNGTHLTPGEAVQAVENAITVYDLVCTDENYGVHHGAMVTLYLFLSYWRWLADDRDGAFAALDKALEHAEISDVLTEKGEIGYTAPLLRLTKDHWNPHIERGAETLPEDWPWWCIPGSGKVKAEMEADPRWREWEVRCKK